MEKHGLFVMLHG